MKDRVDKTLILKKLFKYRIIRYVIQNLFYLICKMIKFRGDDLMQKVEVLLVFIFFVNLGLWPIM